MRRGRGRGSDVSRVVVGLHKDFQSAVLAKMQLDRGRERDYSRDNLVLKTHFLPSR
jgi:hypothetical protein